MTPKTYNLLRRAADIEGQSVSSFVITAAQTAAEDTLRRTDTIKLSRTDSETLARMLVSPPPLTPAMKRAAAIHRRLFGLK